MENFLDPGKIIVAVDVSPSKAAGLEMEHDAIRNARLALGQVAA